MIRNGHGLAISFLGLLAWDASGLDRAVARLFGTAQGFALRDQWWLVTLGHHGARYVGWALLLALTFGLFKAWGPLKFFPHGKERCMMVGSIWLSLGAVSFLKGLSVTSCPWDLADFGGTLPYVSHWAWRIHDGGGGHCFPAGHASTALAFFAVGIWLLPVAHRTARRWLWGTALLGVALGMVQHVRGAHFVSHTLWTAWLCVAIPIALQRVLLSFR